MSSIQISPHKEVKWTISVIQAADGAMKELYSNMDEIGRAVWMPDGEALIAPVGARGGLQHQLWTISYPGGEARRFTNDLSDYGSYIDITADGKTLAAIETRQISHVWIAPLGKCGAGEANNVPGISGFKRSTWAGRKTTGEQQRV